MIFESNRAIRNPQIQFQRDHITYYIFLKLVTQVCSSSSSSKTQSLSRGCLRLEQVLLHFLMPAVSKEQLRRSAAPRHEGTSSRLAERKCFVDPPLHPSCSCAPFGSLTGKYLHCHLALLPLLFSFSSPNPTVLKSVDAPQNTEKDQSEALVSFYPSNNVC